MGKMTIWQGAALLYLDCASRRDAEKGGDGLRNTAEVAEGLGVTTRQARGVLEALYEADLVEGFDERPMEWRITPAGRLALAEEKGG